MESTEESAKDASKSGKWPQRLAACLAAIAAAYVGSLEAWTSPALPYLQGNHSSNATDSTDNIITDGEASWIGSLAALGALFGAIPAGYLADMLGRRMVLLLTTIPQMLGWITITLAEKSVLMLYAARFTLGVAAGAATVLVPLYNEEIAETNIRGELGTYLDIAITIGILYIYAIGAFVPYSWLCISSSLIPILFALTFFWMPESPMYLLSKGRTVEAEKSLRWLRNVKELKNPGVLLELQDMENVMKKPNANDENAETSKLSKFKSLINELSFKSPLFKSVSIIIGLMVFQQLSGINAIIFYTVDIFKAAGSNLSPYYCTLIVGIVQVIAVYISCLLIERLGRRILLLISAIGMVLSLVSLSTYFLFQEKGVDVSFLNWVPLAAFNVYIIAFCIGFGPIPWFMMVELATAETKGWVSSLAVCVNWMLVFVVTKVFPLMLTELGQVITYAILGTICVTGSVFVFLCVPETKGKTREEIQNILAGKLQ